MDYLDKIQEEEAAFHEFIQARKREPEPKPEDTASQVDTFTFCGLFRSEIGWCRLLADSERRQIKLERLQE